MGSLPPEELNSPATTNLKINYAALKEASTILLLSHDTSLNKPLVNSFLNLENSTLKTQKHRCKSEETFSKNGITIDELNVSFDSRKDPKDEVWNHCDDDMGDIEESQEKGEMSVNIISAPGLTSPEMEKALKPLSALVKDGIVSSICFIHPSAKTYPGFQDPLWNHWLSFSRGCPTPPNIFFVFFGKKGSVPPKDNQALHNEEILKQLRSFTFHDSGTGNTHAAKQFLQTILIDKSLSTSHPQPSPSQQILTLRSRHQVLYRTCQDLHNFLQTRLSEAQKSSNEQKSSINSLLSLLEQSTTISTNASLRIQELDTEGLELMEPIFGPNAYFHKYHFWQVGSQPTFKFDMTTPFPIRGITRTQSEKGFWLPEHIPSIGTRRFIGDVRNERGCDAWAKVYLYGWLKEIHGEELWEMRRIKLEQEKLSEQLSARIASMSLQWSQFKIQVEGLEKRLCDAEKDLERVINCEIPDWEFGVMRDHLQEGSLYGVAKAHGLSSLVPKKYYPSILAVRSRDESARTMFQQYIADLDRAIQYFHTALQLLLDPTYQNGKATDEHLQSFQRIQELIATKDQTTNSRDEVTKLTQSTNTDEKKIAETGEKILKELEGDMNEFCTSIQGMISEAQKPDVEGFSRRQEEVVEVARGIRGLRGESLRERDAAREVSDMIVRDEAEVGVLATLIERRDGLDGWWSIWRGARRLSSCQED